MYHVQQSASSLRSWPASRWWRVVVLPASAIIILALTVYRVNHPGVAITPGEGAYANLAAPPVPLLALYNSDKPQKLVRLQSFLGRHPILLVFFDGERGVDQDPLLPELRKHYTKIKSHGVIVLAVSTALPQQNRKIFETSGEFPFEILSDPGLEEHQKWGLVDELGGKPRTGVFFINRAGLVELDRNQPRAVVGRERVFELIGVGD